MNVIKFECVHCGQHLEAPPDMAGDTLPCPHCNEPIVIPDNPTALTPDLPPKQDLANQTAADLAQEAQKGAAEHSESFGRRLAGIWNKFCASLKKSSQAVKLQAQVQSKEHIELKRLYTKLGEYAFSQNIGRDKLTDIYAAIDKLDSEIEQKRSHESLSESASLGEKAKHAAVLAKDRTAVEMLLMRRKGLIADLGRNLNDCEVSEDTVAKLQKDIQRVAGEIADLRRQLKEYGDETKALATDATNKAGNTLQQYANKASNFASYMPSGFPRLRRLNTNTRRALLITVAISLAAIWLGIIATVGGLIISSALSGTSRTKTPQVRSQHVQARNVVKQSQSVQGVRQRFQSARGIHQRNITINTVRIFLDRYCNEWTRVSRRFLTTPPDQIPLHHPLMIFSAQYGVLDMFSPTICINDFEVLEVYEYNSPQQSGYDQSFSFSIRVHVMNRAGATIGTRRITGQFHYRQLSDTGQIFISY